MASQKELLVAPETVSNHQSQHKSKLNIASEKGEHAKKMSETVGDGKSSMGGTTNKSAARRKNQPRFEINDT